MQIPPRGCSNTGLGARLSLASEPGSAQYCNKPTSLSILSQLLPEPHATWVYEGGRYTTFNSFPVASERARGRPILMNFDVPLSILSQLLPLQGT